MTFTKPFRSLASIYHMAFKAHESHFQSLATGTSHGVLESSLLLLLFSLWSLLPFPSRAAARSTGHVPCRDPGTGTRPASQGHQRRLFQHWLVAHSLLLVSGLSSFFFPALSKNSSCSSVHDSLSLTRLRALCRVPLWQPLVDGLGRGLWGRPCIGPCPWWFAG